METFSTSLNVSGLVDIVVYDSETKEIKQSECRTIKNKVLTSGADFIANRMIGTTYPSLANAVGYMAVGSSSTAPTIADTFITTTGLTGGATAVLSSSTQGSGGTINQLTFQATFGAGVATGAITEAGLMNANVSIVTNAITPSGNNKLVARTTFATVNKAAGDSMSITWTITIAVA